MALLLFLLLSLLLLLLALLLLLLTLGLALLMLLLTLAFLLLLLLAFGAALFVLALLLLLLLALLFVLPLALLLLAFGASSLMLLLLSLLFLALLFLLALLLLTFGAARFAFVLIFLSFALRVFTRNVDASGGVTLRVVRRLILAGAIGAFPFSGAAAGFRIGYRSCAGALFPVRRTIVIGAVALLILRPLFGRAPDALADGLVRNDAVRGTVGAVAGRPVRRIGSLVAARMGAGRMARRLVHA